MPVFSGLTVDSPVTEFRAFHDDIAHPATTLELVPTEDDRTILTEFDELCNELLGNLGDFEAALEELTLWKDDFMTQSVPSTIKLQLTMLFARLFRRLVQLFFVFAPGLMRFGSKSVMHEPLFELIRQVRLYSRPWMNKKHALIELEKDYHRQSHVLDVAIRKLEQLQLQIQRLRSEKKIALWERLVHKIFAVFIDDGPAPQESARESKSSTPHREASTHHLGPHGAGPNPNLLGARLGIHSRETSNASNRSLASTKKSAHMTSADEIRAYLLQSKPAWLRKAKSRVNQFTQLLRRNYPRYEERLTRIHRHPFAPPRKLTKYLSITMDTIHLRRLRPRNMPRCWSLLDIRHFHAQLPGRRKVGRAKEGEVVRCNSFGFVSELKYARIKRPEVLLGVHMKETGAVDPLRSQLVTDDERDEEYEDDSDAFSDADYFGDFESAMMDELVERYMNPIKDKSDLLIEGEILNDHEAAKDGFTMQDVMELTLLHAQQMHLMQKEYEDRIHSLEAAMEVMKLDLATADQEYDNRMKQANERAQRLAQKYINHEAGGHNMAKAAESHHKSIAEAESSSDEDHGDGGGRGKGHDGDAGADGRAKTKTKKTSIATVQSKVRASVMGTEAKPPQVVKQPVKLSRHEHVKKKKHFNSAPFAMTFMERLRWFTDEKIKRMQDLQEKFTNKEMAANEERLQQLKLMRRHKGVIDDSEYRDAEFVPYPGHVPTLKMRKAWAEQGIMLPWGGRLQSIKKFADKPNVLNLFDIALRTSPFELDEASHGGVGSASES
ncbi:hypothetical protein BC830DRAFT_244398 [Chytriomyces sp. MP71]|nr:hypothetical protein BC830DRAFT_244398 [Chytriomyces sp. MP71]